MKANRIDVVFIRKSTKGQQEEGQIANVQAMLGEKQINVAPENWYAGTVSRRKVRANAEFNKLLDLVEEDRVATVYVESQDRWGTADRLELYTLLATLRQHDTKLYDLRAKRDLTEKDLATEMLAFMASVKSEKELQDTAYRSLRTRVGNFMATGTWPTGCHPYGFGKAAYTLDGKTLLWLWQPVNRTIGQLFYPSDAGLIPGPANERIPAKKIGEHRIIKLVPNNNPDVVRAVKLVYDLYTRLGLSRRQIATRLNAEGLRFNGGYFGHQDITNILSNPAYAGDTHFGKTRTGALHSFDAKGLIVEVKAKPEAKRRPEAECLVQRGTHEALVDRRTWERAHKKLAAERDRTAFAPRNPKYYLKQLFVCGHCGKGMVGRTEIDPSSGKRTVLYICPTYRQARCDGRPSTCGYHTIKHDEAERLLLDKLRELNLPLDQMPSDGARENVQTRLERLGQQDEKAQEQWQQMYREGMDAMVDYMIEECPEACDYPAIKRLRMLAGEFYCGNANAKPADYGVKLRGSLKRAVEEAEAAIVTKATRRLAELREQHRQLTLNWARASEEMLAVLRQEIDGMEEAMRHCERQSVPLSERFNALYAAEAERQQEREALLAEWPKLEARERGEAMRRLFERVTLRWERTYRPAMAKPTRKRRTKRPGRYRYTLKTQGIIWQFSNTLSASFRLKGRQIGNVLALLDVA